MISCPVDQNFNEDIVDGLTRRDPTLELVRVRDVGLAATPDPEILEWAANQGMVLLTFDRQTIPSFAYARIAAGQPMPGVFLVRRNIPLSQAIDELLIAIICLTPEECKDRVIYFPM